MPRWQERRFGVAILPRARYHVRMQIAGSETIRDAEQALFRSGRMSSAELMDAVVQRLHQAFREEPLLQPMLHARQVVVYAGKGNNAGDAIGLAAALGRPVVLRFACPPECLSADSLQQLKKLQTPLSVSPPEPGEGLLILDGLLGSGAAGTLRAPYAELVEELNALRAASPRSLTLALDIPTGLGMPNSPAVQADVTATIGCVKPMMLADDAIDAVGRILCIPLPEVELPPNAARDVLDVPLVRSWQPRRAYSCFKNRAGRVVVVAGSPGMLGAAQMAAEAAVAAGAGLVVLYVRREAYPLLAARVTPEVMVRCVDSYAEIEEPSAQALLIGPGLGMLPAPEAAALEQLAAHFPGPVVLDADALNAAAREGWQLCPHWILTPHPGEMRRLYPTAAAERITAATRFVERGGCTLLLKGARSIIAGADGRIFYNASGGPYMANGGQGDVLGGVLAALAAQGWPPVEAAAAAAWACGRAAEFAWAAAGYPPAVPAMQVLRALPQVL